MVRGGFRQRLARLVPEQYHGAIYASASGIVLLVLVVLWQESARTLVATEGITRLVPRLAFVLSIGGFVWSICALGTTDPFGMRPTIDYLRGRESTQRELIVRGPYRWVRHPLYLSSLLMIWSSPDLTADRLLFNVLWTIWVVIGTHLEERNLVAILGETYRHYQCTVPALLPYRIPKPRNRHDSQSGPRGGVGMPLMDSGWATNVSESGDETPAA
jgi:protein-S-isoprenylcysteine O-methyltransferase Ste14